MNQAGFEAIARQLHGFHGRQALGRVTELVGLTVCVRGLPAQVGELVEILVADGRPMHGEVVGFRAGETLIMPLGSGQGLQPGTPVRATGRPFSVAVGPELLGRVIDALGQPLDDGPAISGPLRPVLAEPPAPLARRPIQERLDLGVRVLDSLIPCGRGQRLGIFAGSGVGKSSLMGMIARGSQAQVNVICLVGERGREVQEFVQEHLGDGLERTVLVAATSDRPALERIKALAVATTIAEYFRDQGQDVLLMCDSLTRLAMAQREVGLAVGEPPATRGYPPSVWAVLPQLLERAGRTAQGSITGLYTVLVEGDDMNEPVADAARAILDGHLVLSRELAHRNHYPAVDVLESVSRLQGELLAPEVLDAAGQLRELLAAYRSRQDMIALGAYQPGTEPQVDRALALQEQSTAFLRQNAHQLCPAQESDRQLLELVQQPATPEPQPETGIGPPLVPTLTPSLS